MGSSKPVSPEARVIIVAGRLTDCWRGGTETSSALAELLEAVRTLENKQHAAETVDVGCICKGNWRSIVKETESLLDKRFRDREGREWSFFGIVRGSDDYYYGMSSMDGKKFNLKLLSCVGSLEGHNFTEVTSEKAGDGLQVGAPECAIKGCGQPRSVNHDSLLCETHRDLREAELDVRDGQKTT